MKQTAYPDFVIENSQPGSVCGIDEAGRGPWAGPVVAAAVILDCDQPELVAGIHDSKKLSAAKRERMFHTITTHAVSYGVGIASVDEIDRMNILRATMLAMQRAFALLESAPERALIDGNRAPTLPCATECVVKGDSRSLSIAAASILAKVTRDRIMRSIAEEHPQYGFEKHAGYGTKQHQEALATYGVTPWHRKSFAPIKLLLEQAQHSYDSQLQTA